jgi:hypothetical protein
MNHGGSLSLREVVEKHHAALVDELAGHLDSQLQAAREETSANERQQAASEIELVRLRSARETRLSTAESLNQTLRRIRQGIDEAEVLGILLESTSPYAHQAVVLRVENNQASLFRGRSVEGHEFSFPLECAAAVANVCENRDPVVALISDNELSAELATVFAIPGEGEGRKAYLFPVVARQKAVAVLVVCGEPVPAAIELLSEAAGMKIEALERPPAPPADLKNIPPDSERLVQIAPGAVPATTAAAPRAWSDLSHEDQTLHLQAQRVARVKVAEMRLYRSEELRKGVSEANIYGALRNEIDQARTEFLQAFLSKSPTMVDYLHLEILRSLAHDDDRILGQDYPGPMV